MKELKTIGYKKVLIAIIACFLYFLGNWKLDYSVLSFFAIILLCISVWKTPEWWGALATILFFSSIIFIFIIEEKTHLWVSPIMRYILPIFVGVIYSVPFYAFCLFSHKKNPIILSFCLALAIAGCDYLLAQTILGIAISPAISIGTNKFIAGWGYIGSFTGITFFMFVSGSLVAVLLDSKTNKKYRVTSTLILITFICIGFGGNLAMKMPQSVRSGGITAQKKFAPKQTKANIVVLPEGTSVFNAQYKKCEKERKKEFWVDYNGEKLEKMLIECPFGKRESYCLVFERTGKFSGMYEKNYAIWRSRQGEIQFFCKKTSIGKLGIAICFDCLHLDLIPEYSKKGVKILTWPCYDGFGWIAERQIRVARLWALSTGMMIVRSASYKPGVYQGITRVDIAKGDAFIPSHSSIVPGVYIFPYLGVIGIISLFIMTSLSFYYKKT